MPTATPDLRSKLEEVNQQIEAKRTESQGLWKEFDDARAEFAQSGEDANNTESEPYKKAHEVHQRYATAAEELSSLESTRDGIFRMLGVNAPADRPESSRRDTPESEERESISQRIEASEGYRELVASGALNSDRASFNAKLIDLSPAELQAALITGTSDTSGGAFITNERKEYVAQPRRPRRILDLITIGQTGSDVVEYARQTAFTNVAAETAEATSTDTGTKPEATIAFEKVTAAVRTIAHWIPATRRSLADVPQLRTLIESQLIYGLEYRLESQVVNGGGTGEDLTGILNTSNIGSQAKSTDSVADAIHKAITTCRLAFVEPNGVAMHPTDWQLLRLARDDAGSVAGSGGYLWGPPSTQGEQQVWGLPVAVTPAVPDDTALVGDWTKAVLWLREGAQVLASDSHSDFFVKNLVAILAELRAAFGVTMPQAFAKVTSLD